MQAATAPELTWGFHRPAEQAAARRASAREADRIEQQDLEFFERVRAGYAARAALAPRRIVRIDASGAVDQVGAAVLAVLAERYPAC